MTHTKYLAIVAALCCAGLAAHAQTYPFLRYHTTTRLLFPSNVLASNFVEGAGIDLSQDALGRLVVASDGSSTMNDTQFELLSSEEWMKTRQYWGHEYHMFEDFSIPATASGTYKPTAASGHPLVYIGPTGSTTNPTYGRITNGYLTVYPTTDSGPTNPTIYVLAQFDHAITHAGMVWVNYTNDQASSANIAGATLAVSSTSAYFTKMIHIGANRDGVNIDVTTNAVGAFVRLAGFSLPSALTNGEHIVMTVDYLGDDTMNVGVMGTNLTMRHPIVGEVFAGARWAYYQLSQSETGLTTRTEIDAIWAGHSRSRIQAVSSDFTKGTNGPALRAETNAASLSLSTNYITSMPLVTAAAGDWVPIYDLDGGVRAKVTVSDLTGGGAGYADSAELFADLSDETGGGSVVGSNAPIVFRAHGREWFRVYNATDTNEITEDTIGTITALPLQFQAGGTVLASLDNLSGTFAPALDGSQNLGDPSAYWFTNFANVMRPKTHLLMPYATSGRLVWLNTAGLATNMPAGTAGQVLLSDGTNPGWGALDLADGDAVTGLLPDGNIAASITRDTEWDTSSEIATAVTDETGSGSLAFSVGATHVNMIKTGSEDFSDYLSLPTGLNEIRNTNRFWKIVMDAHSTNIVLILDAQENKPTTLYVDPGVGFTNLTIGGAVKWPDGTPNMPVLPSNSVSRLTFVRENGVTNAYVHTKGWEIQYAGTDVTSTTNPWGMTITHTVTPKAHWAVAASDETTSITTGTAKTTFRMPFAMTLIGVRASVNTAPTGAAITIDINEGGTSVLSTKLTIDATEETSTTAATAAVISDSALADDAEITIDFDAVGSTEGGKGVKVTLIGTR